MTSTAGLCYLCLVVVAHWRNLECSSYTNPLMATKEGDIIIGGIFPVHESVNISARDDGRPPDRTCTRWVRMPSQYPQSKSRFLLTLDRLIHFHEDGRNKQSSSNLVCWCRRKFVCLFCFITHFVPLTVNITGIANFLGFYWLQQCDNETIAHQTL